MLTFEADEFAQSFHRTGTLKLMIGGSLHPVEFSTKLFEKTRLEYFEAHPFPRRSVIGARGVKPDSPEGRQLGLARPAIVDVYQPAADDQQYSRAVTEWTKGLGCWLAAACLGAAIRQGGELLTEEGRREFYAANLTASQAAEFVSRFSDLVTLEDQAAADFFVSGSGVGGDAVSPPPEG